MHYLIQIYTSFPLQKVLSIEHPMLDDRLNLTQMKMILTSVSPDHLRRQSELNYPMAHLGVLNSSQCNIKFNLSLQKWSNQILSDCQFFDQWKYQIMFLFNLNICFIVSQTCIMIVEKYSVYLFCENI